ncbi:MAG: glycosyltransferase family 39 protein [Chloroflexi bacterium]|nr:glycosyltransferase family 39 protein [Chloroflexota bacterium]
MIAFARERANCIKIPALLILAGVLLFTSFYRLDAWPATWQDEGIILQAAWNLAERGVYGLRSSEGMRPFDPALTTGPTVVVPVTLAFRLFGIGLIPGRAVMGLYLIWTVIAIYALMQHLYDWQVALLAAFMVLACYTYDANLVQRGRYVLGEVPGLCFILWGAYFWVKALWGTRCRDVALSGLFFGLAILTKEIYILVMPALVGLWLLDSAYYKQRRHAVFLWSLVLAIMPYAGWVVLRRVLMDPEAFAAAMEVTHDAAFITVAMPKLSWMLNSLKFLMQSTFFEWWLPGLIYVFGASLAQRDRNVERLFLPVFALVWLAWYLFVSSGWYRYAFGLLAVTPVFAAVLLRDLTNALETWWRTHSVPTSWLARGSAGLALAFLVFFPLRNRIHTVATASEMDTQALASYIVANIVPGELIESCEWEVDIFARDHLFHHPSPQAMRDFRMANLGRNPAKAYDFQRYSPSYLIDGHYSKMLGVYSQEFLEEHCILLTSVGRYDLYRIEPSEGSMLRK